MFNTMTRDEWEWGGDSNSIGFAAIPSELAKPGCPGSKFLFSMGFVFPKHEPLHRRSFGSAWDLSFPSMSLFIGIDSGTQSTKASSPPMLKPSSRRKV